MLQRQRKDAPLISFRVVQCTTLPNRLGKKARLKIIRVSFQCSVTFPVQSSTTMRQNRPPSVSFTPHYTTAFNLRIIAKVSHVLVCPSVTYFHSAFLYSEICGNGYQSVATEAIKAKAHHLRAPYYWKRIPGFLARFLALRQSCNQVWLLRAPGRTRILVVNPISSRSKLSSTLSIQHLFYWPCCYLGAIQFKLLQFIDGSFRVAELATYSERKSIAEIQPVGDVPNGIFVMT